MVQVGFKSDKGLKRSNNEDACFVVPSDDVYIVADGVGGSNSGEIAARTAVSKIAEYVRHNPLNHEEKEEIVIEYFLKCIQKINSDIYDMAQRHVENKGMATTLVIAYVTGMTAYLINIGDSRGYVCRNGEITQITEDHTYVNTLVQRGIITEAEAQNHSDKNKITKALGGEPVVEPDFFKIDLKKGDVIILCTDGLHGEVDDKSIAGIASNEELTMSEICTKLVTLANRRGGHDNITVVALRI